jgi:transposase
VDACPGSVWRFHVLTDAQWSLIEDELPRPTGRNVRPYSDAQTMVEAINCYRTGIVWRDLLAVFGA